MGTQPHALESTKRCRVHKYHSPRPGTSHVHFILPKAWGGGEMFGSQRNTLVVCPTGHANIHLLLDAFDEYCGPPPWEFLREFGEAERRVATEGWRRRVVLDGK